MTRPSRRRYPKHKDDCFDRFITERSKGADGRFNLMKMVYLFEDMGCADLIPVSGNNGTKRMTAGINLRNWFPDGVLVFLDGTTVTLDLDEESI